MLKGGLKTVKRMLNAYLSAVLRARVLRVFVSHAPLDDGVVHENVASAHFGGEGDAADGRLEGGAGGAADMLINTSH